MPCGPPKTNGSWWRVLTKRGPLEKGIRDLSSGTLTFRSVEAQEPEKVKEVVSWTGRKLGNVIP